MIPQFTGRIVESDGEKGCGWVEADGERTFLHWREFEKRWKQPAAGDQIRFTVGTGPTGEMCAKNAVHVKGKDMAPARRGRGNGSSLPRAAGSFGFAALLLLVALLVFPVVAIAKLRIDPMVAAVYALLLNSVTYLVYASDKKRAQQGAWRIPEIFLHFLEVMGGWPGAFVAQRRLRHKCRKLGYQVTFWLVVALHQYVAFGFLQGWELPRAILRAIRSVIRLANPAFW